MIQFQRSSSEVPDVLLQCKIGNWGEGKVGLDAQVNMFTLEFESCSGTFRWPFTVSCSPWPGMPYQGDVWNSAIDYSGSCQLLKKNTRQSVQICFRELFSKLNAAKCTDLDIEHNNCLLWVTNWMSATFYSNFLPFWPHCNLWLFLPHFSFFLYC